MISIPDTLTTRKRPRDDVVVVLSSPSSSPSSSSSSLSSNKLCKTCPDAGFAKDVFLARGFDINASFVMQRKLGSGSYGSVVLVNRRTNVNEKYAVKRMQVDAWRVARPFIEASTIREISALRALHGNPYVVRLDFIIYTPNDDQDIRFRLFMEAGRKSLQSYIAKELKAMNDEPFKQTCRWLAYQLIEAVQAIHDVGIWHRDLKEANVIVVDSVGDAMPSIKLVDFGMSRGGPFEWVPRTNRVYTLWQRPPEIMLQQVWSDDLASVLPSFGYTDKAETWAIGTILFQMMTARSSPSMEKIQTRLIRTNRVKADEADMIAHQLKLTLLFFDHRHPDDDDAIVDRGKWYGRDRHDVYTRVLRGWMGTSVDPIDQIELVTGPERQRTTALGWLNRNFPDLVTWKPIDTDLWSLFLRMCDIQVTTRISLRDAMSYRCFDSLTIAQRQQYQQTMARQRTRVGAAAADSSMLMSSSPTDSLPSMSPPMSNNQSPSSTLEQPCRSSPPRREWTTLSLYVLQMYLTYDRKGRQQLVTPLTFFLTLHLLHCYYTATSSSSSSSSLPFDMKEWTRRAHAAFMLSNSYTDVFEIWEESWYDHVRPYTDQELVDEQMKLLEHVGGQMHLESTWTRFMRRFCVESDYTRSNCNLSYETNRVPDASQSIVRLRDTWLLMMALLECIGFTQLSSDEMVDIGLIWFRRMEKLILPSTTTINDVDDFHRVEQLFVREWYEYQRHAYQPSNADVELRDMMVKWKALIDEFVDI
jgi:serine/threonine protein kinase